MSSEMVAVTPEDRRTLTDIQDRRRAAQQKVEERMRAFLVADAARFGSLRVEDLHRIAETARNYAWDAMVEVSS